MAAVGLAVAVLGLWQFLCTRSWAVLNLALRITAAFVLYCPCLWDHGFAVLLECEWEVV